MTGYKDILKEVKEKKCFFSNRKYVKSKSIETHEGYVNNYKIIVKNVIYVPAFKKNLISIDSLSDQPYKTFFFIKKNNIYYASIYNKKKYARHNLIIQKCINFII